MEFQRVGVGVSLIMKFNVKRALEEIAWNNSMAIGVLALRDWEDKYTYQ
jgi:hypothetical protein